jgi:hypothetical protein
MFYSKESSKEFTVESGIMTLWEKVCRRKKLKVARNPRLSGDQESQN